MPGRLSADEMTVGSATIETPARPEVPWALRLLPPFPAVAQRIVAAIGQEDVSIDKVGQLIKMDPAFSVELLRVANSALFRARREIASLSQAIVLLGIDRVKSMATCVVLHNMVRGCVGISALRRVWMHSLVTGAVAEEIARSVRQMEDSACTAGLLHNLGTLGLMSTYPAEYGRMLEVSENFGFDLLQTERDLFEIDHCAAGAYLAQAWSFPGSLAAAIAKHHDQPVEGDLSLDLILQVSWRVADALGYAAFSPDSRWSYDELLHFIPPGRGSWLAEGVQAAKERVDSLIAAWPI